MIENAKTSKKYNLISATIAFLLWGGWSFFINTQHGSLAHGLLSGLTQGVCSFIITIFITFLIEKLFNFFHNEGLKLLLPPVLTILFTGSCLVIIHHLIGTPAILYTLAPVLTVAFLFAAFTNFKLYQQAKQIHLN